MWREDPETIKSFKYSCKEGFCVNRLVLLYSDPRFDKTNFKIFFINFLTVKEPKRLQFNKYAQKINEILLFLCAQVPAEFTSYAPTFFVSDFQIGGETTEVVTDD